MLFRRLSGITALLHRMRISDVGKKVLAWNRSEFVDGSKAGQYPIRMVAWKVSWLFWRRKFRLILVRMLGCAQKYQRYVSHQRDKNRRALSQPAHDMHSRPHRLRAFCFLRSLHLSSIFLPSLPFSSSRRGYGSCILRTAFRETIRENGRGNIKEDVSRSLRVSFSRSDGCRLSRSVTRLTNIK